jgi:hypothetical protein
MAAASDWRVDWGGTTLVNVTGAVVVEFGQPAALESTAAETPCDDATIALSSRGKS